MSFRKKITDLFKENPSLKSFEVEFVRGQLLKVNGVETPVLFKNMFIARGAPSLSGEVVALMISFPQSENFFMAAKLKAQAIENLFKLDNSIDPMDWFCMSPELPKTEGVVLNREDFCD